jgi:glycosyltransferase involved in cell wall biosynthesis
MKNHSASAPLRPRVGTEILFLTQVLPHPLDSGAKIRAYYVLRQLAQEHDVTLVSFVRGDDRQESVDHLASFCRDVVTVPMVRSPLRDARAVVKSLVTKRPAVIVRDEMPQMRAALRRLIGQHQVDVVHADQTSMAQYALYAHSAARPPDPRPRLILDAHNALYRIPERMARHEANPLKRAVMRREARLLQRYEQEAYRRFDHVTFVTEVDRKELLEEANGWRQRGAPGTSVIPICVDPGKKPLIRRAREPRLVTHLGTMFWPPNVEGVLWFTQEVWPRVVDRVPEARFCVIGKDPPQDVRDLRMEARSVDVTGYVPDPTPYLAETAVFIVPLRSGGGMRVKIIDAWSWGVPIVSTTIGAEGIDVRDGENILIADEPDAMASAVVRVLRHPELGRRLRENGRGWVEERYNWRQVYPRWDEVYASPGGG